MKIAGRGKVNRTSPINLGYCCGCFVSPCWYPNVSLATEQRDCTAHPCIIITRTRHPYSILILVLLVGQYECGNRHRTGLSVRIPILLHSTQCYGSIPMHPCPSGVSQIPAGDCSAEYGDGVYK